MRCICILDCATSQNLKLDSTLLASVPVPHSALTFMWYLLIAIIGSSVLQRHDIIRMNLTHSNIETGNCLKQVVCISLREYLLVSLKNLKHTIVNWLWHPGAKFGFIKVIIKICLGLTMHGLPRWCCGKRSTCQPRRCKRHGFDPGSRRSPGEGNGSLPSILAWEIPQTEEPGGLQSMGSQRVRHSWVYTHTLTHFQRLGLEQWNQFLTLFTWVGLLALSPSPGLTFTLCAAWSLVICLQLKCVRVALLVSLTLTALEHFRHLQHITALVSTYKSSLGTRGIYLKASSEILWQIGTI